MSATRVLIASVFVAGVLASPALAQTGHVYGGAGLSSVGVEGTDIDLSFGTADVRAGYAFSNFLSIEGELSLGRGGQPDRLLPGEVGVRPDTRLKLNLDQSVAAYVRGGVVVGNWLGLHARAGVQQTWGSLAPAPSQMDAVQGTRYRELLANSDLPGLGRGEDSSAGVAGIGAEVFINKNNAVRFDYTRVFDGGGMNQMGVSYVMHF
jgi:hypothetical protein